jgi:hypothetical protein
VAIVQIGIRALCCMMFGYSDRTGMRTATREECKE